jgi:ParB family chromosome partitioning protein
MFIMFGFTQKNDTSRVISVAIENIKSNPNQPRKLFDKEQLEGLAESIKHNGILQPLTIRNLNNSNYELVAGERRLRASRLAGLTHVPCIEVDLTDSQSTVMALLENIQREDLHFFEEADGYAKLIEICELTQEEIALRIGKTQSSIANKLRLLKLSDKEREIIVDSNLTERHARALLKLGDNQRITAIQTIISRKYNVAEAEYFIDLMIVPPTEKKKQTTIAVVKDVRLFINTIGNAINVMKKSGIDAVAEKRENDEFLEYTIKIFKYNKSKQAV